MMTGTAAVILFCGLINLCIYFHFRRQFVRLVSDICRYAEQVMRGEPVQIQQNRETLTSKVVMEMEKMERLTALRLEESKREKQQLLEMISEITHQIKTPVSNLKMYCEMLSEEETPLYPSPACAVPAAVTPELSSAQYLTPSADTPELSSAQYRTSAADTPVFQGAAGGSPANKVMEQQLIKLEFLLDTLLKASRLETDMIHPEMENRRVLDTLAAAVNNIIHKAGLKNIEISADCGSSIQVCHDKKWTAEAIENILDNAVKYTPKNGSIHISVHVGEMYTEIRIQDTGKGIDPAHINDIFKRFYREKSVSQEEGLGLGLYLARYIITLQKGYIAVRSVPGEGSCFSVCLPNRI
ncbi:sensor histidine kinase [Lachnospiraceae bacterium]|jgi:signal transduction histidine kinase|nr:HAMP domain-containing sensor histidine kinase [uncultured Schaedlerella sp.]MCI9154031.1 HAMP domain-containing histidine kinase [Ruminococcus sp.]NBI58760.1 sensor histidine kinase [Lachnospiraceae bacterium]